MHGFNRTHGLTVPDKRKLPEAQLLGREMRVHVCYAVPFVLCLYVYFMRVSVLLLIISWPVEATGRTEAEQLNELNDWFGKLPSSAEHVGPSLPIFLGARQL